jgi:hypothetical protein
MREGRVTLLEVGILNGASLSVWEEYFPRAKIIGADIDSSCRRLARERVVIEVIDQSNLEDLVELGRKYGPFDIIIEDGSHQWEHQITTLRTLFPFMRNGGYYVVEDLHTNFGELASQFQKVATKSCVAYLKDLADLCVADDTIDLSKVEDPFLRTYARNVGMICFHKHCCLLQKDYSDWRQVSTVPFVDAGANAPRVLLMAHFGTVGDCESTTGALRGLKAMQRVQGFAITPDAITGVQIEYRARLSDGSWTDWVSSGTYVGTRAKSQDLTGLSVRLAVRPRRDVSLVVAGLFGADPNPVVVGDGQPCVHGSDTLCGIQVIVQAL